MNKKICVTKQFSYVSVLLVSLIGLTFLFSYANSQQKSTSSRASESIALNIQSTPSLSPTGKLFFAETKINNVNPLRCSKDEYIVNGLATNVDQECAKITETDVLLNKGKNIPVCGVGVNCLGISRASNGILSEFPSNAKVCKAPATFSSDNSQFSLCFYCTQNTIYPDVKSEQSLNGSVRYFQLAGRNKCYTSNDLTALLDARP